MIFVWPDKPPSEVDLLAGRWLKAEWEDALKNPGEKDPDMDRLTGSRVSSIRWAVITQLLGKKADLNRSLLCLKPECRNGGWRPRKFAKDVVVRWSQRNRDIVGSSEDPYASNPLRRPCLTREAEGIRMNDRQLWRELYDYLDALDSAAEEQIEWECRRCLWSFARRYRQQLKSVVNDWSIQCYDSECGHVTDLWGLDALVNPENGYLDDEGWIVCKKCGSRSHIKKSFVTAWGDYKGSLKAVIWPEGYEMRTYRPFYLLAVDEADEQPTEVWARPYYLIQDEDEGFLLRVEANGPILKAGDVLELMVQMVRAGGLDVRRVLAAVWNGLRGRLL